jgi:hypothetical protein
MLRAGVCGFQPLVRPWSERCLLPPDRFHLANTGIDALPRATTKALGRSRASLGRLAMKRPLVLTSGWGSERAD